MARMDLRDRFAAQVASALAATVDEPGELARRAYDVAEAMIAERARRIDADEARAISFHPALLDPPVDYVDYDEELDPGWEPPYDPSWDIEERWSGGAESSRPPGPGLARTIPEVEERKERSG
jgi:hypothetical protein